jgi:MbtH protein
MGNPSEGGARKQFFVVCNEEEQYSIWSVTAGTVPDGWKVIGDAKPKEECLEYISEVWKDMRPASLRRSMEALSGGSDS